MNKTEGASENPEFWSPGRTQSTSLSSVALTFAFGQQATDRALNVILIVVLVVIMVSLGCTMEIAKFTTHLRKAKGVAIAVMAQYSIMPLTAFVLGKLFQLGASESLAILICGCCPGGHLSNIFSLAQRGDMNLKGRQTVFTETGCQNIQLCSTTLKTAFAPETIGPLYFFPLFYLLFQLGEGLLLILVFRIHDRIKKPNGA
ncbi:sodium/bile acid cotransporter isoform X2 [Tyto alba]|uniref:sodium/bile acid cotransporter isoform X2 n=1 Tax=Tyto alba TaxID=56313 RepID=UPI001C68128F|nr:sodium/bile acid cotransporter isoform X2 [Tyto alba]